MNRRQILKLVGGASLVQRGVSLNGARVSNEK